MTFLSTAGARVILSKFILVLEGKICDPLPKSIILEFPETVSGNNISLSNVEDLRTIIEIN